jgi:hypothetical protein
MPQQIDAQHAETRSLLRVIGPLVVVVLLGSISVYSAETTPSQTPPAKTPVGPFGLSRITTDDGRPADIDFFQSNETCGVCHDRQLKEFQGSMHSASHSEPLYRSFAELARKEAGDKVYAECAGCHSPAGVVTGLIPKKHDPELPAEAKAGVACDVCHQISALTGAEGPWHEPGNASVVLQPGQVKFGDSGRVAENRAHTGEKRAFFAKAELCASCHTVIHPVNGLRIESTYAEWKASVYAEKGIQCQDCHMRSVADAARVAETLQPVVVKGPRVHNGAEREIYSHYFVGGNSNTDRLSGGTMQAAMAEERLKSAARIELVVPAKAAAGKDMAIEVVVRNVAAGHNLPTGVTELRQMWIDLRVSDASGKTIFRSGQLDAAGELPADAVRFGAVAVNDAGKVTVRPWEMARISWKHTIPPKGAEHEKLNVPLPAGTSGACVIEAKLLYRSVAPGVVAVAMDRSAFTAKIVEMTSAKASVTVGE